MSDTEASDNLVGKMLDEILGPQAAKGVVKFYVYPLGRKIDVTEDGRIYRKRLSHKEMKYHGLRKVKVSFRRKGTEIINIQPIDFGKVRRLGSSSTVQTMIIVTGLKLEFSPDSTMVTDLEKPRGLTNGDGISLDGDALKFAVMS